MKDLPVEPDDLLDREGSELDRTRNLLDRARSQLDCKGNLLDRTWRVLGRTRDLPSPTRAFPLQCRTLPVPLRRPHRHLPTPSRHLPPPQWKRIALAVAAVLAASGACRPQEEDRGPAAHGRDLLLDPSNPEWTREAPLVWQARFETSKGEFVVEVTRELAPIGVDRFYNLVRLGYYDNTRFHRVSPGYIVQFGLHGDPAVNAAWLDQQIPDDPGRGSNVRGTLAFAKTPEANTRNTQIYINLGDNTRNDVEPFAIFGSVIEGMDVLDRLFSGYGEESGSGMRQGRQGPIIEGGNEYLDREFPLLDRLIRASIVDPSSLEAG